MQRIGLIHPAAQPSENCLPIDPFLGTYTKNDLILVVAFMYIGLVQKKCIRVPRNHRCLNMNEQAVRSRRVREDAIAILNEAKEYYDKNNAPIKYLRSVWLSIETKISQHRIQWLENIQVKSKKDEGKEELKKYTRTRQEEFNKWKRYGQVQSDSEGEDDSEDGNDHDEEYRRQHDLENGRQVSVRQGFVEW